MSKKCSNNKSRLIILIRNTQPDFYGGAETYQLKLATELKRHHYCPIIISSSRHLVKEARSAKIATFSAPYLRRQNWSSWRNLLLPLYLLWQIRLYFWYRSVFKKYCPIAVDIQSRDDWLAASIAARRRGIKVLWTDHMDFRTWALTNVNQKFKNPIGKAILREAAKVDYIIFISNFERAAFEQLVAPRHFSNLLTIRNGVADCAADFSAIKPAKYSACYVGRLVDYKGINELLSAWRAVARHCPGAVLNIYGDGTPQLIRKVESTPGVIYHGFTNRPQQAIASSQLFILPSHREGLSLSLLDAAMLGRTIIASDVDGNPEIVIDHQTGLLVPAKDATSLTTAITTLFSEPTLAKRLARAARAHYEQNFNFSRTIERQFLPLLSAKAKEQKR